LVLYMALIFFVSSRARPASLDEAPDVLLHGGAYFVLALLAVRALARGLVEPAGPAALVGGVAIAILYGASDELHQSLVPERMGSWLDWMYDGLGAALAGVGIGLFWRFRGGRT
jgi:VanZ family protein